MLMNLRGKCFDSMNGAYAALFTPYDAKGQDEANQVVELMIESDNWSYRKAMMKFIGLDCGWFRKPFEPLTDAQYAAYAKRCAKVHLKKVK